MNAAAVLVAKLGVFALLVWALWTTRLLSYLVVLVFGQGSMTMTTYRIIFVLAAATLCWVLNLVVEHANAPLVGDVLNGRQHTEKRLLTVVMFGISLGLLIIAPSGPSPGSIPFFKERTITVFNFVPTFVLAVWLIAQASNVFGHAGGARARRDAVRAGYIKKGYAMRDTHRRLFWVKLLVGQVFGIATILFAWELGKQGVFNTELLGFVLVNAVINVYWTHVHQGWNRDLYEAPRQNIEH